MIPGVNVRLLAATASAAILWGCATPQIVDQAEQGRQQQADQQAQRAADAESAAARAAGAAQTGPTLASTEPARPFVRPVTPPPGPPAPLPPDVLPLRFEQRGYAAVPQWNATDVGAARRAFLRTCAQWARRPANARLSEVAIYAGTIGQWDGVCALAADTSISDRDFWERNFTPWVVSAPDNAPGRLTAYYEPLLNVSSVRTDTMVEPILSRPSDLITVNAGDFDPGLSGRTLVGRLQGGALVPYRTRAEIDATTAPVLGWGTMGDVLSLQIQGSGRVRFEDGREMRAAFTATNGHPFRSIAQELVRRGVLSRDQASMDNITAWFATAPPEEARAVINANPRTVFFELRPITDPTAGPSGATSVGLEPGGSGAIDPRYHPYGLPFFITANAAVLANSPDATINRLLIAQDTGGAIRGPLRVDLFWGTGDEAGLRAGRVNHDVRWWVLLPNGLDPVATGAR